MRIIIQVAIWIPRFHSFCESMEVGEMFGREVKSIAKLAEHEMGLNMNMNSEGVWKGDRRVGDGLRRKARALWGLENYRQEVLT